PGARRRHRPGRQFLVPARRRQMAVLARHAGRPAGAVHGARAVRAALLARLSAGTARPTAPPRTWTRPRATRGLVFGRPSGPGFEDQVEGRLGRAPEPAEAAREDHLAQ